MNSSKQSSWLLIKHSVKIFNKHRALIIPIALARLAKFILGALIVLPLVHGYTHQGGLAGIAKFIEAHGIHFNSPLLYIILAVIFFITYVFSTLFYSVALSALLAGFRGGTFSLTKATKLVSEELIGILSWCLINKTIGPLSRLNDALIRLLCIQHPLVKNYQWRISSCLTLPLILDQHYSAWSAIKKSRLIIQESNKQPKFPRELGKVFLYLLLISSLPLITALIFKNHAVIWAGVSLSLIAWYLISIFMSIISFIASSVFYEYVVNHNLVKGFTEDSLKYFFK